MRAGNVGARQFGLWFLLLLAAAPALVAACDCNSIPLVVAPVCGADGEWYQNACIAHCVGAVLPPDAGACDPAGKLRFSNGRMGPDGAEGSSKPGTVTAEVLNLFAAEDYHYLGRTSFVKTMDAAVPKPVPYAEPAPNADGEIVMTTLRATPSGDVYVGRAAVPAAQANGQAPPSSPPDLDIGDAEAQTVPVGGLPGDSAAAAGAREEAVEAPLGGALTIPPFPSGGGEAQDQDPWSDPADASASRMAASIDDSSRGGYDGDSGSEWDSSSNSHASYATLHRRRFLEVIGADDRRSCPVMGRPWTAVGQIEVVDGSGMFICTGTLIAPDKVLTAGHCVWNVKRNAFYFNLNFAPGRYRQGASYVSPFGSIQWKSVTVFDAFKRNPGTWDLAVVTLQKPVGRAAGTLPVGGGCLRNTKLTLTGYPQDKARGTCTMSSCTVPVAACGTMVSPHHCDTVPGMSGAPLLDASNRVRMIHIAGSNGRPVNQGTAMTDFVVNAIRKW